MGQDFRSFGRVNFYSASLIEDELGTSTGDKMKLC